LVSQPNLYSVGKPRAMEQGQVLGRQIALIDLQLTDDAPEFGVGSLSLFAHVCGECGFATD